MFPDPSFFTHVLKFKLIKLSFVVFLQICLLTFFFVELPAQWIRDPAQNKMIVLDPLNPVNILLAPDTSGGGFLIWQDSKTFTDKVYFLHFDENGKSTMRSDGKNVSLSGGNQLNPVILKNPDNTVTVLWKGVDYENSPELFIQKIGKNGKLYWGENGIRLTDSEDDVSDYSITNDNKGRILISYLSKAPGLLGEFKIVTKTISNSGVNDLKFQEKIIYSSNNRKSDTKIIAGDNNDSFVFWLENVEGKSVLKGMHIDSTGYPTWGKDPVRIMTNQKNVLKYLISKTEDGNIHILWQIQSDSKQLFHQLISEKGRALWGTNGNPVTKSDGIYSNPSVLINGNSIFISWLQQINDEQKIYLQRFNENGTGFWKNDLLVSAISGKNFARQVSIDKDNNILFSWLNQEMNSEITGIYSQKISAEGLLLWNPSGVVTTLADSTVKSYLRMIPDQKGGLIVVFKKTSGKETLLSAQRIFNKGNYFSEIFSLNAELYGDSVRLNWYSINETEPVRYKVERTEFNDSAFGVWKKIADVEGIATPGIQNYFISDMPESGGTIYYRVSQEGIDDSSAAEITRINYLRPSDKIIVGQNIPNPFSDSTWITFFLPSELDVSLKIFDYSLKQVYEIPKTKFKAGQNQISFIPQGLMSGVYFYKFECGDFIDVKKMVLAKK